MESSVTGGCQCGRVRYRLTKPLINSHVCHCRMCQRAVGNVFAALVGNPVDAIIWETVKPEEYASSNLATRYFCNQCGTPLGFFYTRMSENLYVTTGSLDDPAQAPIRKQYGIESRLPWVHFCEEVPGEETLANEKGRKALEGLQDFQYRAN